MRTKDPGEGYRFLVENELILKTDEVWYGGDGPWRAVRQTIGETWQAENSWPMRRRLLGKAIRLYTTCNDLGVIGGVVYATGQDLPADNVREIKVDPSTGTLYVEDGHGRPSGEA